MYFENVDIRPFSTRKQIFSQYKLPDDPIKIQQRMEISKDKKSSNEVLLRQLGLFKFNLSSVLYEKNDLLKKLSIFDENIRRVYNFIAEYNEGDFADTEQIEQRFKGIEDMRRQNEIIQNVRSSIRKSKVEAQKFEQSQYLMRALIIYKGLLNYGESLKFEGQTFRLGTLSNFNPKYTQVKFSKRPQQSENAVMRYVSKIIDQSSKAMESKVRYENNYEKYRFLLQEDKYSNCWKSLQQLYSPKQVQLINFEMLNILNAFDEQFERFKSTLRSHGDNCKKYHGVLDSMDLMGRQTQQMAHTIQSRDQIISTLAKLSCQDPQQMQRVLLKCQEEQILIEKNIKIYHINEKLFASYNTQTNLRFYSKQRNTYSIKLNELESRLGKWSGEYESIKQIVQGYNLKKNVGHKRIGLTKNSAEIDKKIQKIEEVNTRKNKQIALLKNNVLESLKQKQQNTTNSKNNGISARRVSSKDEQFPDDETLQRQKSFFSNLQKIPNPQKKPFLLQNHQKIKQYIEYNRRKSEDTKISPSLRERIKAFEFRFSILTQIAKTCKQLIAKQTSRQLDQEQNSFESIVKAHLKTIQKQLSADSYQSKRLVDQLVYQHVYDYSLFSHCFDSQHWFQLTGTLQSVQGSFISRPVSFTSHDNVKALKQLISFTKQFVREKYPLLTIKMLQIFSSTLFQLTNGVSMELYNFEDYYWGKMTQTVSIFYQRKNYMFQQSAYNSRTIDKSSFFSLPYLIHLNRTSNKYKVLNLDVILTKIVKMIYDQFTNYRQHQIFENAVCLTYLMRYIRNVCSYDEVQQKVGVISKLRRLLTSQLLKSQFVRNYEIEKKQQAQISNKMIQTILGLQGYLAFNNATAQKKEKLTQFELKNNKYLKGIQQEIKPLVINLSAYTSDLTLQRSKLIWGFGQWPFNLSKILQNSQSLSNVFMFSCFSIYRQNLQSLLKLVEFIEWNSIKESDGFLIRMIRKENFYLKKQLIKLKALEKQNVWKEVDQLLENLLLQLQSSNSLRITTKDQAQKQIRQIELKMKKTLTNIAQRSI